MKKKEDISVMFNPPKSPAEKMGKENSFYRPFSLLNDFVEKNRIRTSRIVNNETVSFPEAMKDVKQIDRSNIRVGGKNSIRDRHPDRKDEVKGQLENVLKEDYTFNVTNLPEYMEGYEDNINPIVMEKLRNGEFSIQGTLDLHGHGRTAARELFEEFIRDAIKSQLNCIRVIHGRGLKSRKAPVLKDELTRWIIRAMNRKWVAAFASCKMCDGGPGATYILLKKKPVKKRLSVIK